MYIFSILFISLFMSCTHINSTPVAKREMASLDTSNEAPASLIAALATQTRVITHDTYVYHWTKNIQDSGQDDLRIAGIDRGRAAADGFWNDPIPDYGLAGNGLYFARDPVMSTYFGSVLLSLTLPVGTRLLDIRNVPATKDTKDLMGGNIIEIGKEAQTDLASMGCSLPVRFIVLHLLKNERCMEIFKSAFKTLKISGNIHHWWGHNTVVCDGEATAFVIWDPQLFTDENVRVYAPETVTQLEDLYFSDPKAAEELAYLNQLAYASKAVSLPEGAGEGLVAMWRKGDFGKRFPEVKSQAQFSDWMNKHSFNCHGIYPEDKVGFVQDLSTSPSVPQSSYKYEIFPIKIRSAIFGGNTGNPYNVTAIVMYPCEGKGSCNYSNFPMPEYSYRKDLDMTVEWTCGDETVLHRNYNPPSTRDNPGSISCRRNKKGVAKTMARVKIKNALMNKKDVTPKMIEFCDLKPKCEYTVGAESLGFRNSKKERDFKLEWYCTDAPGEVFVEKIPAPSELKAIKLDCSRDI